MSLEKSTVLSHWEPIERDYVIPKIFGVWRFACLVFSVLAIPITSICHRYYVPEQDERPGVDRLYSYCSNRWLRQFEDAAIVNSSLLRRAPS